MKGFEGERDEKNASRGRGTYEVALLALFSPSSRERERHGRDLEELAETVGSRSEHLRSREGESAYACTVTTRWFERTVARMSLSK